MTIFLALTLAVSGFAATAPAPAVPSMRAAVKPAQTVSWKTPDGWTISARYRPARGKNVTIVLAHGVGSSGAEWEAFAARMAREGIGTLALDLRGHAQSRGGPNGESGFESFNTEDAWRAALQDLFSASEWLKSRGVPASQVAFGGASIGANLAALAAARETATPFLLLLSPGLDYRGVRLNIRRGLTIFAAAAPEDGYAMAAIKELEVRGLAKIYRAPRGHGVQMLSDTATMEALAAWASAKQAAGN